MNDAAAFAVIDRANRDREAALLEAERAAALLRIEDLERELAAISRPSGCTRGATG